MPSKEEIIQQGEIFYKNFTFTQSEDTYPFFYIDFDYAVKIKSIQIFPKKMLWTKLKNITVQVSQDGETWETISTICFLFKKKLIVFFRQFYTAKKCRIIFSQKKLYINAKVNIKIVGKKLLFLSSRFDGIGVRLLTLLNAMYFAKITNNKFGYIWHPVISKEGYEAGNVLEQETFFSKKFIEKYCYNNYIPKEIAAKLTSAGKLNTFFSENKKSKKYSITDLQFIDSEFEWGWFFFQRRLYDLFDEIDKTKCQKELATLWNQIDFSDNIKNLKKQVDKIYNNYSNFKPIHFRNSDVVHSTFTRRFNYVSKALLIEFFLEFLLQELPKGKNFIIFTDTVENAKDFINQIDSYKTINYPNEKWGKIVFAKDLYEEANVSHIINADKLFDAFLMAKYKNIYAPRTSGYSELSQVIGNSQLISLHDYFPIKQHHSIIKKIRKDFILNPYMLAHSAIWCYRGRLFIDNIKAEDWNELLPEIYYNLEDKLTRYIITIDLYLYTKQYELCNDFLKNINSEVKSQELIEYAKEGYKKVPAVQLVSPLFVTFLRTVQNCKKENISNIYIYIY